MRFPKPATRKNIVDMRGQSTNLNPAITDPFTKRAALALIMSRRTKDPNVRDRLLKQSRAFAHWQK